MKHDDTIRQGATFYRTIEVFDSSLTVSDLRSMTPRASLLGTDISMTCAWLGDETKAEIAWSLSRDVTATLDPSRTYEYNLDLYNFVDTNEVLYGRISVRGGQKPL